MCTMTKSPVALAKQAIRAAKAALPDYSSVHSRHDFTQHQLFVILVPRQFLETDYRGIIQMLKDFSDLRKAWVVAVLNSYQNQGGDIEWFGIKVER